MKQRNKLIESIEKEINASVALPHQAATIGFELFLLIIDERKHNAQLDLLLKLYLEKLPIWGFDNLHVILANYAILISSFNGELEYEEMHKLFSLCDEIYALDYLGLNLNEEKKNELNKSLRLRFSIQRKIAKIAAIRNVESWSKELWWYKENR